jgi:6-phosphogluconate dehydrogenase
MQLGMIGLGRMGANMVRRLMRGGHECVVYDVSDDAVAQLAAEGAVGATSLDDFVHKLDRPRNVWIMVPAAYVESTIADLLERLAPDDAIIDGGNSYYRDDIDRAEHLGPRGIHYLDVGTSGGVFGLERGYCLMVGGEDAAVERLSPVLQTLAPGVDSAPRSHGRDGAPTPEEEGWLHCGPHGAGHFVKMVHNGIEYGLMAAYAEGLNVLHKANIGKLGGEMDAETTPLRDPKYYQYDLDIPAVTEVWRRGSVVSSWLLDLTAEALAGDPGLESFGGRVSDSGEGRWTVLAAVDEGVPIHVLSAALMDRFGSRGEAVFANKILSAMRKGFGGHAEKPVAGI